MSHARIVLAAASVALLALPVAGAQASRRYPTGSPNAPQPPVRGKRHTLKVCTKQQRRRLDRGAQRGHRRAGDRRGASASADHRGRDGQRRRGARRRRCFTTIQKAVDHAHAGDTVRVPHGTYRESVTIRGAGKRELKLIGDRRHPRRVLLLGDFREHGNAPQNGVQVNGADRVTIAGMMARDYAANGFFAVNVNGYQMDHLVAARVGAYGLYAFNSIGGTMRDSEAYYTNDAGYYVGQTPPQSNPERTFVRRVRSWGNVLGFSGTNMRYVTIEDSIFWDNGLGIVPNTLATEKHPPPAHNTIIGNDVFWNNFDYFDHNPFYGKAVDLSSAQFPIGSGIFLYGGDDTTVTRNRVWGNNLFGLGLALQIDFRTWLPLSLAGGGERKVDCLRAQADILRRRPLADPEITQIDDCRQGLATARRAAKRLGAGRRARLARHDGRMAAALERAADPRGDRFHGNRLDFNAAGDLDLNGRDYLLLVNPPDLRGPGAANPYAGRSRGDCMGPAARRASAAQRGAIGHIYGGGDVPPYPSCSAMPRGAPNPAPAIGTLGFAQALVGGDPTAAWAGAGQPRTTSGIRGLRPGRPLVTCEVVRRHCRGFPR